jgi:ABC-type sugar transport system ATPase subunit
LPNARFAGGRDIVGKPIVLGIRPEDIALHTQIASAESFVQSASGFRALVDQVELAGAETTLHVQTGAHALVCRTREDLGQRGGGFRAQFEIDVDKAHLFDAESGGRIMREA